MEEVNIELRKLMDSYDKRLNKLNKEMKEAKREGNVQDKGVVEVLQRQCRIMIAELFETMRNLGVLDQEEIDFGALKIT